MTTLVTGASGTLGAAVCRRLLKSDDDAVVAMARDRSALLANCPAGVAVVTGCVRDVYRLVLICKRYRVRRIVHCAAIKHVGVCEDQPRDAIKTNLLGVLNALWAIRECDIGSAVFVSSDKATDATVYGASKMLGERAVAEAAIEEGRALNCVRPGNIIGSAGSVVDVWRRAHERGEPIRLDLCLGVSARRFVMSADQAAGLVMDAAGYTEGGLVIAAEMPIMSMRTLAAAVAPGATIKPGRLPRPWTNQTIIGKDESVYLQPDASYLVLDRSQPPRRVHCRVYSTAGMEPMDLSATKLWLEAAEGGTP